MWQYQSTDELYHHGVLGMKWGIRRYQNKDGSLTSAGRKRAAKLENDYKSLTGRNLRKKVNSDNKSQNKPKSIKEMTNEELREKTNRMTLENNYIIAQNTMSKLNPKKVSAGQRFISHIGKQVVVPAATEASKNVLRNYIENFINGKMNTKNTKKNN